MSEEAPTERQLAFAVSLGISMNRDTTSEELSSMIDRALERRSDPANELQWMIAEAWGIELYGDISRDDASRLIFGYWDENPDADIPPAIEQLIFQEGAVVRNFISASRATGHFVKQSFSIATRTLPFLKHYFVSSVLYLKWLALKLTFTVIGTLKSLDSLLGRVSGGDAALHWIFRFVVIAVLALITGIALS